MVGGGGCLAKDSYDRVLKSIALELTVFSQAHFKLAILIFYYFYVLKGTPHPMWKIPPT